MKFINDIQALILKSRHGDVLKLNLDIRDALEIPTELNLYTVIQDIQNIHRLFVRMGKDYHPLRASLFQRLGSLYEQRHELEDGESGSVNAPPARREVGWS